MQCAETVRVPMSTQDLSFAITNEKYSLILQPLSYPVHITTTTEVDKLPPMSTRSVPSRLNLFYLAQRFRIESARTEFILSNLNCQNSMIVAMSKREITSSEL